MLRIGEIVGSSGNEVADRQRRQRRIDKRVDRILDCEERIAQVLTRVIARRARRLDKKRFLPYI